MQKMNFKLMAGFILVVLFIIVVLQNTTPVETRLLFITLTMPRAVLLLITLLIGIALGLLISMYLTKRRDAKESQ